MSKSNNQQKKISKFRISLELVLTLFTISLDSASTSLDTAELW